MTNKTCDLKSCLMCRFSLGQWLHAIGAHKTNIAVKKGQTLFKEGDAVTGVYFIYTGKVKVHQRWDDEKELILRFAQKGDMVGQLGLGSRAIYPVSATAIEPTVVCYVDMAFFESTIKVNTDFTYALMRFFADELLQSETRMRNLAHMPVKGRLIQALLHLQNQFGTDAKGNINIELTRQDLASFTGAVYESLFRTLNDLIAEGLVTVLGKSIAIKNADGLSRLTEDNQ